MIYQKNRLPANDSHEISCFIGRLNLKLSSAANYRWRFKDKHTTAILESAVGSEPFHELDHFVILLYQHQIVTFVN